LRRPWEEWKLFFSNGFGIGKEGRKEEGRKEVNKELNSNDWNKPGKKLRMQQIEVF
jgi:hypothetical protein